MVIRDKYEGEAEVNIYATQEPTPKSFPVNNYQFRPENIVGVDSIGEEYNGSGKIEKRLVKIRGG